VPEKFALLALLAPSAAFADGAVGRDGRNDTSALCHSAHRSVCNEEFTTAPVLRHHFDDRVGVKASIGEESGDVTGRGRASMPRS
jgi:hypothetical protein